MKPAGFLVRHAMEKRVTKHFNGTEVGQWQRPALLGASGDWNQTVGTTPQPLFSFFFNRPRGVLVACLSHSYWQYHSPPSHPTRFALFGRTWLIQRSLCGLATKVNCMFFVCNCLFVCYCFFLVYVCVGVHWMGDFFDIGWLGEPVFCRHSKDFDNLFRWCWIAWEAAQANQEAIRTEAHKVFSTLKASKSLQ